MANVLVVFLFLTFALKTTTREGVRLAKTPMWRCQQQLGLVNLSDWLRLIIQASS